MRRILLLGCAIALIAACGDGKPAANAATTTVQARNPKYDLTFRDWQSATLTQGEQDFEQVTAGAFGIGTNPPKMLEIGYDICERIELHPSQSVTEIINEYAGTNSMFVGSVMSVGLPATKYLCP